MSASLPLKPHALHSPANWERRFELSHNCSLTRTGARVFLLVVAITTFAVAGFFTLQGFWPMLPFAGLEVGLLWWALRVSMRRAREGEIITFTTDSVTIERHSCAGMATAVFPRYWAKVKLHAPRGRLDRNRLTIESQGRVCEIGRFLTDEERRTLAARLKPLVGKSFD